MRTPSPRPVVPASASDIHHLDQLLATTGDHAAVGLGAAIGQVYRRLGATHPHLDPAARDRLARQRLATVLRPHQPAGTRPPRRP